MAPLEGGGPVSSTGSRTLRFDINQVAARRLGLSLEADQTTYATRLLGTAGHRSLCGW